MSKKPKNEKSRAKPLKAAPVTQKAAAVKVAPPSGDATPAPVVESVAKPEGSGGRLQAMQNARRNG